jgi:hypothetical protein
VLLSHLKADAGNEQGYSVEVPFYRSRGVKPDPHRVREAISEKAQRQTRLTGKTTGKKKGRVETLPSS